MLPNVSIKRIQAQTGVWTIDGGSLRFVPVRIGQTSLDGRMQVLDGVKPGTRIVVHSEKEIGSHSRIQIVDTLTGQQP